MSEVAEVRYTEGPMQISREDARRRINIGVNVRNRDVASLVEEIRQKLDARLEVPPGYSIRYGGQFENLEKAQARLSVAVPIALGLIFILLYFTFGQLKYALMIFTAVPLSAIGGISALALRGMPFSISAGVGFIALFGVAVLNGIVLISYFNSLRQENTGMDLMEVVVKGSLDRLRPVLMTATVAALGFLPMALSTSNGAEVQKPLATVVIGGLITATLLTLLLMPILYFIFNKPSAKMKEALKRASVLLFLIVGASSIQAQTTIVGPQDAIDRAVENHPDLKMADLRFNLAEQKFDQARRIPATDFSLMIGQTNTNLVDYNFSINQSLGAVGADKKRKNLALQEIVLANQEKDVVQLQLIAKVQKLWFAWSNESARLRRLQAQQQLYESLREKAQLQFDQGEINRLQLSVAESKVMQIEQQLNQQGVATEKAQKDLAMAAWIRESDIQIDTNLLILPFPLNLNVNQQLVRPFEQQQVIAETQIQVSEKELAPQWNFGYFNQSIRPSYSFQGLSVGTSVPLAKKAGRAKIEEDRVRKLMADQRLDQVRQQLDWEREKVEQMVRQYNNYLRGPANDLLTQATLLRDLANTQLQAGEIDFFQYIQSVDVALQNELEYLNAVHQYNQAVIDLRFLVE
jgi:cobalt-zinc-cadmium resistance protein CzcA